MTQLKEQMDVWLEGTGLNVEAYSTSVTDLLVENGTFEITALVLRIDDRSVKFVPAFLIWSGCDRVLALEAKPVARTTRRYRARCASPARESRSLISLPRDENRLTPAESCCPDCGGVLSYLGEDAAEQLELMRSAFRVIRTVREKHAFKKCDRIVQAPAPSRVRGCWHAC